jgi:hypothetical protein
MSPVPRVLGRQYTARKAAAVKRLERWRRSGLQPEQCVTGSALVARELAAPGSVWPARPRVHWRRPRLSPTAVAFVDLVQEHQEHGAQALWISHAEHATLARKATRTVQYAVAELLALGVVEQVPVFTELDPAAPMPDWVTRAQRRLQHAEKRAAYRLGPVALTELQRTEERLQRPPGYAERKISAEARQLAARNSRFSVRKELRSNAGSVLPEEAPEDPRTAVPSAERGYAAQSVSPAATVADLSQRRRGGPTPDAPPLELRNSWTREAAAPPPRRAEPRAEAQPPPSPQTPPVAHTRAAVETSTAGADAGADPVLVLLREALRRLER